MGHDNEKDISITSEVIQDFGESQFRCESVGDDFDVQLDIWANAYAGSLAELGIEYPDEGSIEDRCRVLTTAAVHHRLKACLSCVNDHVERLNTTGEFTPEDASELSQLQRVLDAEEEKSPHFTVLIEKVRMKTEELLNLIRLH